MNQTISMKLFCQKKAKLISVPVRASLTGSFPGPVDRYETLLPYFPLCTPAVFKLHGETVWIDGNAEFP